MVDAFVAKRALGAACGYHPRYPWMGSPFALGADAAATDGRVQLVVHDAAGELGLAPAAGPNHAQASAAARHTDPHRYAPLGRTTLRALAEWAGDCPFRVVEGDDGHLYPAGPRHGLIGPAAFDRELVAKVVFLLAVAGDGPVEVCLGDVTPAASEAKDRKDSTPGACVLLRGEGWDAAVMCCTPAPPPGEGTRLPLDPPGGR